MALPVEIERLRRRLTPPPPASVSKPVSAQMELPLGPPSGPNPPVALPQPSPTPQTGANFAERMARPTVAVEPTTPGQQFAQRMQRVSAPEAVLPSRINSDLNKGIVGVELARGAWDTGVRTLGKMEQGQGLWPAVGNTIKENLLKVQDNPFGAGSASQTISAINKTGEPPKQQVPIRQPGALQEVKSDIIKAPVVSVAPNASITGTLPVPQTPIGSQGPTTTATVPGKGTATFQPGTGINDAAVMPGARSGQIFSGASTDAEAARNLQARAEQNQAAQFNINSMNRGAEAERDLRATRLGVSRGVLDRMEGRNDTEAAVAAAAAQSAPSNQFNPLSMPGDNLYDTRSRQATYDSAVKQALAGNKREQQGAAATLTALNDFREKNLAAQVAQSKGGIDPIDMGKFLLDQERFKQTQNADANKFLLDKEKFNYQQGLDKERLTMDRGEAEGKQAERQLARQKYMDESRKAFVNEFAFSDPKAPREQIGGAVFDISQATGVPPDIVSQFYEQAVKDSKIDYGKGGPKDPMALNKLVAARITQAYQGQ